MSNQPQPIVPWWKSSIDLLPTVLLLGPALTYLFMVIGEAYLQGYASVYRVSPSVFTGWSTQALIFTGFFSSLATFIKLVGPVLWFLLGVAVLLLGASLVEPHLRQWWTSRNTSSKPKIEVAEGRLLQADRVVTMALWLGVLSAGFIMLLFITRDAINQASTLGQQVGQQALLTRAQPIDLISTQPLPRLEGNPTTVGTITYYAKRVYLIAVSNDVYYVFETLDPATCRPQTITMIATAQVATMQSHLPEPLDIDCTP